MAAPKVTIQDLINNGWRLLESPKIEFPGTGDSVTRWLKKED